MTIPRDLGLEKIGDKYYVTSAPSKEMRRTRRKNGASFTENKTTLKWCSSAAI